ncbi:MAG: hypothetical protein HY876_04105, partial [Coriobacteriales bacterium]|nr:hypothetical protein [Coriobacteriales bacterium]
QAAIEALATRSGDVGDRMAEGSRSLAESFGRPEAAMQVKGLELPAYDPRGMQGQGLGYATSNRGGPPECGQSRGFRVLPLRGQEDDRGEPGDLYGAAALRHRHARRRARQARAHAGR